MPRASAFPLIKNKHPQYCKKLVSIPPCAFWIHETTLSNYLGLPRGSDQVHGQNEALTAMITCIKDGGGGNKRKGTWVSTKIAVADLFCSKNEPNNIHYVNASGKEEFPQGTLADKLIRCYCRWFNFDVIRAISASEQLAIANELVGA